MELRWVLFLGGVICLALLFGGIYIFRQFRSWQADQHERDREALQREAERGDPVAKELLEQAKK